MLSFETRLLTRLIIYGFAGIILTGSLVYSNYLARQLEEKEKSGVELYRDALKFITDEIDPDDPNSASEALAFIHSRIIRPNDDQTPKILVGEGESIDGDNIQLPETLTEAEREIAIRKKLAQLKQEYPPIEVEFDDGRFQKVYYGNSLLVQRLRWFPFVQMLVAFVFIGAVFAGFAIAKRNEQNKVWVGLAKETAHQLGTPVSSLMAWIELLKLKMENRPDDSELILEMERDIKRLENIAERFSKIGSKPELVETSLKKVLDHSAEYLKKRMTQRGSIKLELHNNIPLESKLFVNPQLFDWVIENLLKNALDAIQSKEGVIRIDAGERGLQYYIDVTDTGKGIPKSNFKKVFEPGFTTKKRGWGLGLSLTKRIVENYHQGKIFVKSSEVDKGTTFRVLLPKTYKS
ncbi:MAG: HAMP domain-containing sensor histidine kinase [Bacteroidia bacterium]